MLFLVACPPYAAMLRALIELQRSNFTGDLGGKASLAATLLQLGVGLPGMLLWIALGFLLFGRTARAATPGWAKRLLPAFFLLSTLATAGAVTAMFRYPGGSSIVVPESLPLLLALLAMWLRLPALRTTPRPHLVTGGLLAAIAGAGAAAVPLAALDKIDAPRNAALQRERVQAMLAQQNAEFDKAIAAEKARYDKLTPDSHLADYLDNAVGVDHEQLLARMRRVKTRQGDAVTLLDRGRLVELADLWQLDLQPTPALCRAYNAALKRGAGTEISDMPRSTAEAMEKQGPNLQWLAAGHCDLGDGLAAVEAKARLVGAAIGPSDPDLPQWQDFLAMLETLRQR